MYGIFPSGVVLFESKRHSLDSDANAYVYVYPFLFAGQLGRDLNCLIVCSTTADRVWYVRSTRLYAVADLCFDDG